MKILLPLLIILLNACDSPRDRTRSRKEQATTVILSPGNDFFNGDSDNTSGGTTGSSTNDDNSDRNDTGTTTTTTTTIPTEFSHCTFKTASGGSFQSTNSILGNYTICANKNGSKTDLYLQSSASITDSKVCLFPMSSNGSQSLYIGEPRCLLIEADKFYRVNLIINRPGFESYTPTGLMVMKDVTKNYPYPFNQSLLMPDAFMVCMNYLQLHSNTSYCSVFQQVGGYATHTF